MQPARTVTTIYTHQPARVTLEQMGRTARAAADTLAMRTWAARLATKAGPKDYRGQLEKLFQGVLDRWRYVMEDGEWVAGTPRALLGQVLGLDYSAPGQDPTTVDIDATPVREHGWGDCDDVATLMASGVIALGMQPVWRVSRASTGQAHVSVAATTPDGKVIQLDPVGHPHHGFDWAQSGPGIAVDYHSMEGVPLSSPMFGSTERLMVNQAQFAVPYPRQPGPQYFPRSMVASPVHWQVVPYGYGAMSANEGTYLGVLARAPRGGLMPYQGRVRRHLVCVSPNDTRGPRVLAIPGMHARTMMSGTVVDGCPAVDQYGAEYSYSHVNDLWVPRSSAMGRIATYGFGATRAQRRARRKARRRRTIQKVGRFFKRVGKGIRKVASKIMGSKFVQTIVAGALQVFGVPMMLTRKLLEVASRFVGSGGLIKLLKGIRKNPKQVMKTLARTVAAAGRSDLLKGVKGFSGTDGGHEPVVFEVEQGGSTYYAAPVEGIVGLDGIASDAGEGSAFSERPTPGYFYRAKKGDTLSAIAKDAYGKALPGGRWISESPTNAYATRASKAGYETNYYGPRIISLLPRYSGQMPGVYLGPGHEYPALWIPPAAGVEPTVAPVIPEKPLPPDIEEDEAFEEEEELEPAPPTPIPVPPAPPVPVAPEEMIPEEGPVIPVPTPTPVMPVTPEPEPMPVEPTPPHELKPIPWPVEPTPPHELKPIPWPEKPRGPDVAPAPTPSPGPGGSPGGDVAAFLPLLTIASLLM